MCRSPRISYQLRCSNCILLVIYARLAAFGIIQNDISCTSTLPFLPHHVNISSTILIVVYVFLSNRLLTSPNINILSLEQDSPSVIFPHLHFYRYIPFFLSVPRCRDYQIPCRDSLSCLLTLLCFCCHHPRYFHGLLIHLLSHCHHHI